MTCWCKQHSNVCFENSLWSSELASVVAYFLFVAILAETSSNRGDSCDCMQIENSFAEGGLPSKLKTKMMSDVSDVILLKKKNVVGKDGFKVSPEHDCDFCSNFVYCWRLLNFIFVIPTWDFARSCIWIYTHYCLSSWTSFFLSILIVDIVHKSDTTRFAELPPILYVIMLNWWSNDTKWFRVRDLGTMLSVWRVTT